MINRWWYMGLVLLTVWLGVLTIMTVKNLNVLKNKDAELTRCISTLQKAVIQDAKNLDGVINQINGYIQQQKKGGK